LGLRVSSGLAIRHSYNLEKPQSFPRQTTPPYGADCQGGAALLVLSKNTGISLVSKAHRFATDCFRMTKDPKENYTDKDAQARFEAALKSALIMPHKPLKDKPKVRAAKKTKRKKKTYLMHFNDRPQAFGPKSQPVLQRFEADPPILRRPPGPDSPEVQRFRSEILQRLRSESELRFRLRGLLTTISLRPKKVICPISLPLPKVVRTHVSTTSLTNRGLGLGCLARQRRKLMACERNDFETRLTIL